MQLAERVLYVRRSIGAYDDPDEATTKSEAGERLVPLRAGAQAALEALYAAAVDTSDDAPVFATVERKRGRDGVMRSVGRPLSPRMVTRVYRRYADRAGIPATVRLHDIRHTTITDAIAQGEDIMLVAAFAGHAKTSTTTDTYGHLMPGRVAAAARRMRPVAAPVAHSPSHTLPTNVEEQRSDGGSADGAEASKDGAIAA